MKLIVVVFLASLTWVSDAVLDENGTLPLSKPGRILLVPSWIFPVHKMTMMSLAQELVSRGHTVVVWQIGMKHDGIKVPKGVEERFWEVDVPDKYIRNMHLYKNATVYNVIWDEAIVEPARKAANWMMALRMCELVLESRKADFDKLVAENFDVVVLDDLFNPCGLLHAGLQKSVFVYWSFTHLRTESAWANQSPSPPSYIPVPGTGYTDMMGFWQRAYNLLSYVKTIYIHQRIVLRRLDTLFQKFYPGVTEAFYVERNASLNYVNTPPIFDFARPYMPRVQFVGGLHCRKAQPLTGALGKFVTGASDADGFVLFTTGHSVQWNRAPQRIINIFLETFKAHPNVRFVWQYDGPKIEKLPGNVHLAPWLPQQDLLGHKKCKSFITLGGLNSVIEGMWHGVPLIGVPLFADFKDYLLRATDRHAGIILDKTLLSVKTLTKALRKVKDPKYVDGALFFQDLLHDVPYTEMQAATFWVEFIIRHGEYPQARSGADDLNIVQYFLIDVIAFLSAVVFLILATVFYVIKYSFRLFCWTLKKIYRTLFGKKDERKKKKE